MPTTSHQLLVLCLYELLLAFTRARDLGTVVVAPLRVRLWRRNFREPDIVFLLKEHANRIGEDFWTGADLVVEVVSGTQKDRQRDLVIKRREYARGGISEYWIIDPQSQKISVLRLSGKRYVIHGEFALGATASSWLLKGFTVDVSEAFSQGMRFTAAKRVTRKQP
jgi:Uma2 family endonuclease